MIPISRAFKGQNYRYTSTKRYKEYQHQRTCLKSQRDTISKLETLALKEELMSQGVITLKEFNNVVEKVYATYPPDKQDQVIHKILKARLLLK